MEQVSGQSDDIYLVASGNLFFNKQPEATGDA